MPITRVGSLAKDLGSFEDAVHNHRAGDEFLMIYVANYLFRILRTIPESIKNPFFGFQFGELCFSVQFEEFCLQNLLKYCNLYYHSRIRILGYSSCLKQL